MTQFDSQALLTMARDKSSDGRKRLAQTITDLFVGGGKVLTERERSLMFDILHHIVHEFEMAVRRTVSEQLADWPDTPKELAVLLANDEIEVAYPMLVRSGVLQDTGLIEIIQQRTREHQLAIAIRDSVSEDVSDALVKAGDENVIQTLLSNPEARITRSTMEYLVEQSQRVNAFQEPILHRKDLDGELAERMLMWVSAALRNYIIENFEIDNAAVDEILEHTALYAGAGGDGNGQGSKSEKLAEELLDAGAVTPELLVSALSEGEVHLFISLLRKLSGLRRSLLTRMLFEPGGEGLAILCKYAGFSGKNFDAIFDLSCKARVKGRQKDVGEREGAAAFFRNLSDDAAQDVVRQWKRNANYLSAIREVGARV